MKKVNRNKITINESKSNLEIILQPSCNLVIGFFQIITFIGFLYLFIIGIGNISSRDLMIFDKVILFHFVFISATFVGVLNRFKLIYSIFFKIESFKMNEEFVEISKKNLFRSYKTQLRISDIEKFEIKNFDELKEPNSQVSFLNYSDLYFHLQDKKIRVFEFKDFNILSEISEILKSRGLRFQNF